MKSLKSISVQKNAKILLVDDNKDLLQVVQIILKGQGFETVLAQSVKEAERKIRIQIATVQLDACAGFDIAGGQAQKDSCAVGQFVQQ